MVAHFHYVLSLGAVFAIFAAWYYWYPKMFGIMYNETLANAAFLDHLRRRERGVLPAAFPRPRGHAAPLHRLSGRLRRSGTASPRSATTSPSPACLLFLYPAVPIGRGSASAPANPWGEGATTLEWTLTLAAAVPPVRDAAARRIDRYKSDH